MKMCLLRLSDLVSVLLPFGNYSALVPLFGNDDKQNFIIITRVCLLLHVIGFSTVSRRSLYRVEFKQ